MVTQHVASEDNTRQTAQSGVR